MMVITGATGFVGREVVKQARAAGQDVRAVVRDPRRVAAWATKNNVEMFHGNVLFAPSLAGAMDGALAAIHLVGIINEWRENTFHRAHVEATQNVVVAAKQAGVKRFIHMSALGTRENAPSRYHQTKWDAEQMVRNSGLAWTIFRPSLVYGPGDISINVLARLVRLAPVIPVLGNGQTRIQPVSVEVVARCFIAALYTDESVGRTYDLCGPESFTWDELFDKLRVVTGKRNPKLHLPLPAARVMGWALGKLLRKPPFNREQAIMAAEDNTGDPRPAELAFGISQEPFDQSIARYLA